MSRALSAFAIPARPGLVVPQPVLKDFDCSGFRGVLTWQQRKLLRLQLLVSILHGTNPSYVLDLPALCVSAQPFLSLSASDKMLCRLQLLRQIASCN